MLAFDDDKAIRFQRPKVGIPLSGVELRRRGMSACVVDHVTGDAKNLFTASFGLLARLWYELVLWAPQSCIRHIVAGSSPKGALHMLKISA